MRAIVMPVTPKFIEQALQMPHGMQITDARFEAHRNVVLLTVEHPHLPEVPVDASPPEANPEITVTQRQIAWKCGDIDLGLGQQGLNG